MDTKREHRTHAEGSPRGKPCDLSHSPSGRLIGKFRDNNSVTLSASVDMAYGYCDDYHPHAVRRIFDHRNEMLYDMRWDDAGNLGQVSMASPDNLFQTGRFLFWTEDNRMHAAADDRYYSYYAYDHSGGSCASREQSQACLSYAEMEQRRRSQRRLKLAGDNNLLDVNADFMATYTLLNEPTLYPSAYMVLTNKGYTNVAKAESRASSLALPRRSSVTGRKHYYAGAERVAARLGGGGLDALHLVVGSDEEMQRKADVLFDQSLLQVNDRVLEENDQDCIMLNEFAREEFGHRIDGIPIRMKAKVKVDHSPFMGMVNSMLYDRHRGQENEVYFYHSDHLGSASWITDFSGVAVQHIQYLPYGEPYVNQHPFGYNERFTFTGKERDEETGYNYHGARYYDAELTTMWLSVDPMADKYPSISPYAYCAWNPVRLVDPDGRDWYDIDKNGYIRKNEEKSKDCKDFDVVHSTMTNKTIRFDKKIIEKASNTEKQEYEFKEGDETISGSAMGTQIDINATTKDAKSLYDFCISNTDHIEFSLFQGNSAGTEWYISTSHAHQEDEFSTALGYALALASSFYSHQHNHPYLGVDCTEASKGDKTFIRRTTEIMKIKNKNVSPSYKLAIIVDGNIKDLKYNEKTGFYK